MTIVEQFKGAFAAMPEFVLGAPDRWVMSMHAPVETGVDHPAVVCRACKGLPEWPCEKFAAADRRHREAWQTRR